MRRIMDHSENRPMASDAIHVKQDDLISYRLLYYLAYFRNISK